MREFRESLRSSQDLLETCGIPDDNGSSMGLWFEYMVAYLVLLPIPIAIADIAGELILPEVHGWREACINDPTFPPSLWQYVMLGQTSSVPADERMTPALPPASREQLDAVQALCLKDSPELWAALAELQAASRHFVAMVYAPGKLGHRNDQLVANQRRLRTALRAFLSSLLKLVRQLHGADRAQLAALQPRYTIGAPFEALEALYPEVVARRQAHDTRIARCNKKGGFSAGLRVRRRGSVAGVCSSVRAAFWR